MRNKVYIMPSSHHPRPDVKKNCHCVGGVNWTITLNHGCRIGFKKLRFTHKLHTDAVNSKYRPTHDVEARSRSINAACFKDRVRLTKDLYFPRCGWWRSHMAGICSDCSTREIIIIGPTKDLLRVERQHLVSISVTVQHVNVQRRLNCKHSSRAVPLLCANREWTLNALSTWCNRCLLLRLPWTYQLSQINARATESGCRRSLTITVINYVQRPSVGARRYCQLSWPTTVQFITLRTSTFLQLSW